jgi:hypothetical protein
MIGLYSNPNQVLVTKNSGIESLRDLRASVSPPELPDPPPRSRPASSENLRNRLPRCTEVQYVGFTEAIDLMRNKQLDGACIMAESRTRP